MEKTKNKACNWVVTAFCHNWKEEDLIEGINRLGAKFWAYILHDKDIESETGEAKREHYHLVLKFSGSKTFNTLKNIFKEAHIEAIVDFKSCVQYLIHKNDKNKYQYEKNEIKTSSEEWLEKILESETGDSSIEAIYREVNKYLSEGIMSEEKIYEELKKTALKEQNYAKHYRLIKEERFILTIINDMKNYYKTANE